MTSSSVRPPAPFPRMVPVRQHFAATEPVELGPAIRPGLASRLAALPRRALVAVAVGSRGITGLADMVGIIVQAVREAGADPFILPAMGSHGGATAEGQVGLLADYGVTPACLGVPFRPSMEVRGVGTTPEGVEVVCAAEALGAEAIVLVNRIKPHTDFAGSVGSGLLKMLVVGLGKHAGAAAFHRASSRLGHERVLRSSARLLLARLPILAGVAIIENQRHETARIEVLSSSDIESREAALCAEADRLMPRLPFAEIDLLIVDRMGKNISGTGMDPAVIGRMIHGYSLAEDREHRSPQVRRLVVRDLTPESHGNAIGLGLADFTTTRLIRAMDRDATVTNSLTALSLQGAKIPIAFDTDREVLAAALATLPLPDPGTAKVVRIADTLSVERFEVSEALWSSAGHRAGLAAQGPAVAMQFGADGNLCP